MSSADIGATDNHCYQESKNPANLQEIAGLLQIGAAGFEPTTSTTPTKEHADTAPGKTRVKRDQCEALHQMLHQISKCDAKLLAQLLLEALGRDGCRELATLLTAQIESPSLPDAGLASETA